NGLIFFAPAKHRACTTAIIDRIGETLDRWLLAQMLTMLVVFAVTSIGLAIIGIPSSLILGIQAGLLAFIPTISALIGGLLVVWASLASGWVLTLSPFILFLGVHALESYVLTPLIQLQALDIPPATLFRVPDPVWRRLRFMGARTGVAANRKRQGRHRLLQGRRTVGTSLALSARAAPFPSSPVRSRA